MACKYAKINYNSEINATVFIEYPSDHNPKGNVGMYIGRIMNENGRFEETLPNRELRIVDYQLPEIPAGYGGKVDTSAAKLLYIYKNYGRGTQNNRYDNSVMNLFGEDLNRMWNNSHVVYEITNLDEEEMMLSFKYIRQNSLTVNKSQATVILNLLAVGGVMELLSSFDKMFVKAKPTAKGVASLCDALCGNKYARKFQTSQGTRNRGNILSMLSKLVN
ncbi:hypothetical protein FE392_04620 [Xenorhabdus sp. 12]|uniref:Uncharacterized protein n=1 Tax=Xenorhabdus santafensis TaxID=2582833 RepID=A0ABU4S5Y8_9GAMM|nr:hypothetical protein [Xenorhabdus sp. 12]MDX7986620.1 hypothetical protein [Xenorhabdus sp. 12]